MIIVELLKRQNIYSIEASNGQEAVDIVNKSFTQESQIDIKLILMDLEMPIMCGTVSAFEIRKLEKENNRKEIIPIIAITAQDTSSHKKECLKVGMQEYLLKPVSVKMIKVLLQKYAFELAQKHLPT